MVATEGGLVLVTLGGTNRSSASSNKREKSDKVVTAGTSVIVVVAAAAAALANQYCTSPLLTTFPCAPPSVVVEVVFEIQVASLVLKQLSMLVQKHPTCRSVEIEHNRVK